MWIAKEIVPPQPGDGHILLEVTLLIVMHTLLPSSAGQLSLPQSCEIALEHIVERKRMDDLAFSICDGRFHEQKVCHLAKEQVLVRVHIHCVP